MPVVGKWLYYLNLNSDHYVVQSTYERFMCDILVGKCHYMRVY